MIKVLVTSGGTTEFIDEVRVLTNISTGNLGAIVADCFAKNGFEVTYLCTKGSTKPTNESIKQVLISDVKSLMEAMEREVPAHDVVIHSMAVSDFGFQRDSLIKLKSDSPEAFVEYLKKSIYVNPKVLSYIKTWNPNCTLISFKFEVGKDFDELKEIALKSLKRNNSNLVVANDKIEMNKAKDHVAYLIAPDGGFEKVSGKINIAESLVEYVLKKESI